MKKTRFRISKNDTIKACLFINNQLITSIYDSEFTTINEVVYSLFKKTHYKGMHCYISIYNQSSGKIKSLNKIIR